MGQSDLQKLEVYICMPVTEFPKIKSSTDPILYTKLMNLETVIYKKMYL
jgi:hypothetical protein